MSSTVTTTTISTVTTAATFEGLGQALTVIASAFLYLQWFHYMRQGYGIARMYYRATPDGQTPGSRDVAADFVIYLVPIYGIAARSATMGDKFLGLPVKVVVLPETIVMLLGVAAAAAAMAWLVKIMRAAIAETLDLEYTAFIVSHVGIFLVAYVFVADVNTGWLAINVWHNLQYVLVVWMSNAKRYASGIDPSARFLSRLSQPGRVMMYFACCLAITTIVYAAIDRFTSNAYDLVIEGESYRQRLKPKSPAAKRGPAKKS